MLYNKNKLNLSNLNIIKAIECLKNEDFENAKFFIHSIMLENYSSAEAHNLLAIYYELNGDLSLAKKHYRASLALDPTLKSADNNLKRICSFKHVCTDKYIDYGEYISKGITNI